MRSTTQTLPVAAVGRPSSWPPVVKSAQPAPRTSELAFLACALHICSVLPAVTSRAPARDAIGLWRKGHSGNPGGRPKSYKELIAAARAAAPDAFARMVELMADEDTRVAHLSAVHVLERAYGKPKEYL